MLKKIRNLLVGAVGAFLIRLIGSTLQIQVKDDSGFLSQTNAATPVIFAFWHNRMFLMPYLHRRFLHGRRVICLVSASQDGEMIARVLARFGLATVRGSSSRRGKEAFRELTENLRQGWDVAITPDGPRGPRHQAHVGVVGLAALSGCSLIPATWMVKWKIELPSWDRFIIPLPFSPCIFHVGQPLPITDAAGEKGLDESRRTLETRLMEMEPNPKFSRTFQPSIST
ncbi:MAG: lysophospholipid acyltransferase family protein [Verrucomicrobia bacterium]|nr:lysophospholipid acyltransferase family protein [Verrucomicrobiota bacterium]